MITTRTQPQELYMNQPQWELDQIWSRELGECRSAVKNRCHRWDALSKKVSVQIKATLWAAE